jgi:hypothetical protein
VDVLDVLVVVLDDVDVLVVWEVDVLDELVVTLDDVLELVEVDEVDVLVVELLDVLVDDDVLDDVLVLVVTPKQAWTSLQKVG